LPAVHDGFGVSMHCRWRGVGSLPRLDLKGIEIGLAPGDTPGQHSNCAQLVAHRLNWLRTVSLVFAPQHETN
jgi:hypothetical protein